MAAGAQDSRGHGMNNGLKWVKGAANGKLRQKTPSFLFISCHESPKFLNVNNENWFKSANKTKNQKTLKLKNFDRTNITWKWKKKTEIHQKLSNRRTPQQNAIRQDEYFFSQVRLKLCLVMRGSKDPPQPKLSTLAFALEIGPVHLKFGLCAKGKREQYRVLQGQGHQKLRNGFFRWRCRKNNLVVIFWSKENF